MHPVGIAIRNEKSNNRIEESVATLAENLGVALPERPVHRRNEDPFFREMKHLEWQADAFALLADATAKKPAKV